MVVLAEFPLWAIAVVCLGLALILTEFVLSLLGWLIDLLNLIPKVNLGTDFLQSVEQAVSNAFGVAFGWIDHELGASIHALARATEWVWREIEGHALLIAEIATGIYPIVAAIHGIRAIVHRLTATHTVTSSRVKQLEREYRGIEAKIKTLEHDLSKGIGEDVLPRIKTLEREAAHIQNVALPAAEAAQQQSDSAISNLYDWIRGKASIVGAGTFAVAVEGVLAAVGLDWLACRSRNSVNGKSGCNLWNDLEALLVLAAAIDFSFTLEELAKEAEPIVRALASVVAEAA